MNQLCGTAGVEENTFLDVCGKACEDSVLWRSRTQLTITTQVNFADE